MSDAKPVTADQLKALGDDLASTFEHLKGAAEKQDVEIAKYGEAAGETKAAIDKISDRMDGLETKMTRPAGVIDGADDGADELRADFAEYIRKGVAPESLKALSRGTDTAGGYLVPEGVARELVKNLVEISPIRQISDTVTITEGSAYPYLRRTSEAAAGWSSEGGDRAESTNPAFGAGRIPLHEMYVMVDISRQLLDMSGFDVEGEWMGEATEQCDKLEGAAFISNAGTAAPQGFTHANAGLSNTNSGHATLVQADTLLGLPYDLKGGYLANAQFVMNRATLKAVRQLKDGNGQYLWAAGFGDALKSGAPATIDGFKYTVAQDMPDISAGTFPIAFGDFKQGYKIVDHTKVHQIRDEVTQAATGNVRFWVTRYVGGQVVKTEAIRLYEIAA